MSKRIKILIGILIIIIIAIIGWFTLEKLSKEVEVIFPIDNEEEAIAYVKSYSDIKDFIKTWSNSEHKVECGGYFVEDENIWEIICSATRRFPWQPALFDVFYVIDFKPDGTILYKGPGAI